MGTEIACFTKTNTFSKKKTFVRKVAWLCLRAPLSLLPWRLSDRYVLLVTICAVLSGEEPCSLGLVDHVDAPPALGNPAHGRECEQAADGVFQLLCLILFGEVAVLGLRTEVGVPGTPRSLSLCSLRLHPGLTCCSVACPVL